MKYTKNDADTYSALLVAKCVIKRCHDIGKTISNLKLQKILYFIQAQFLVDTGKPCFEDEIQAWPYGPVVPNVYSAYRMYGSSTIPANAIDDVYGISEDDLKRINRIVDEASQYSASQLVQLTHNQTPWINAYIPGKNKEISNESIRDFFMEGA